MSERDRQWGEAHTITFTCGHTASFVRPVPKQGEYILCIPCDTYRVVETGFDDAMVRTMHVVAGCLDCDWMYENALGNNTTGAKLVTYHSSHTTHVAWYYSPDLRKIKHPRIYYAGIRVDKAAERSILEVLDHELLRSVGWNPLSPP